MTQSSLIGLAREITSGAIRVIDLTQTLSPEFPTIVLPPEFGQCAPFRLEEISRYDERGPAWYWNNFTVGEHTGTHFDAPIHWVSGKDLPDNATDTIPASRFIAPAAVLDCSREAAADPDFVLTVPFVEAWEERHGPIEAGSWVLLRTDWSKKSYADYAGLREDGAHTPGPGPEVVRWLVEERDVHGFGTETIGTDAGQAHHFNPPYPAHFYMHGKGRYGLQCLTNLHLLPPKGAVIIAAPLKIKQGSGSPLRVLALVARGAGMSERNVAIVTGGSVGIGAEICRHMLAAGYEVVSLARRRPDWTQANLSSLEVDLLDGKATREAAVDIARRLPVSHIVHNAGAIRARLLPEVAEEDLHALVQLHLAAGLHLVQAALPGMRSRGFGRIVMLSSRAALGLATRTAYSATKAGIIGMTRTWALELAPLGITANVVAPGPIVDTEMFHDVVPKGSERQKALAEAIPVKRLGTTADVARAVMFFADPGNGFVTGQTLFVCGGSSVGSLVI